MKLKNTLIILLLLISFQSFAQKELLTVAEQSDFTATSLSTDVYKFIEQLKDRSDFIRVESIATSAYGADIPMMILANPMPLSPEDLINDDRIVIYIQANIHSGEVEGKEASLMLARDLLKDPNSEIFKKVILLIVPNLNPDGNDQMSLKNRTNQNGPASVGLRHNGQQLDINRDGLKLETPEFEGILNNIFNRWDPALTIDCHTTNGSFHEEAVTFTWMMNPNGDRNLINYMRDLMMPSVNKDLYKNYNIENCFYGEFIDRMAPEKGWVSYASAPKYLTNYIGIRNRFSILNENYVYADYKSRVIGCYYLLKTIVEYSAQHGQEMKVQIAEADRKTIERGLAPALQDSFAIRYKGVPIPEKVSIKFIEAEIISTDNNGWRRYRKTDRKRTVSVPYIADYFPTKQVKFPFAYVIDKKYKAVLKNIITHGIIVEQLKKDTQIEVLGFEFKEINPGKKLNQGHYNNIVKGEFKAESKTFKAGTYIVRTSQKLANVAAYLLEPQTEDGLLYWNYFDRYLRPQWGSRIYPYPVYKIMDPIILETK